MFQVIADSEFVAAIFATFKQAAEEGELDRAITLATKPKSA
jgi:hypothetical protein